jgi:hypothetical protein
MLRSFTTEYLKRSVVELHVSKWKRSEPGKTREGHGADCLIDEMQVLVQNGWAHL